MSDPQAISSHDPIESTAGTLELVAQAAQRGAADAREAAARTWTATGLFVSRFVYTTCYIISYGVVFPSVLLARAVPVNNAAVRGLIEGAQPRGTRSMSCTTRPSCRRPTPLCRPSRRPETSPAVSTALPPARTLSHRGASQRSSPLHPLMIALASLVQIVLINVVLSGDNALVIAMVARHLPAPQRRAAMLWGGAVAIALRLALTLAVSYVLMIPGLRFVGAILLVGIACKLIQDEDETNEDAAPAPTSLRTAVVRIAVADLVMSLDNVVAIAGVSGSDPVLLVVGLVLSIGMILAFSQVILALMNRFRWVVYAGTAVLALTAAGMIRHDLEAVRDLTWVASLPLHLPLWADWAFRGVVVGGCLTSSRWWPRRLPAVEAA